MNNLLKLFENLTDNSINNAMNDVEELDLSKKEDLDKFINTANSIKESSKIFNNTGFDKVFGLFDFNIDSTIDSLIESAKEIHNKLNENKKHKMPTRPSENVDGTVLSKIADLSTEYVDTMLKPYADFTDEQRKSIYECLTEFGCWIYTHK